MDCVSAKIKLKIGRVMRQRTKKLASVLLILLISLMVCTIGATIYYCVSHNLGPNILFYITISAITEVTSSWSLPEWRLIPAHIRGEIVDSFDGRPMPNIDITIVYEIGNYFHTDWYREYIKADNEGRFNIKIPRGGQHRIFVYTEGYYPFSNRANIFFENKVELYPIINPLNTSLTRGKVGAEYHKDGWKELGFNFQKGEVTYDLDTADIKADTRYKDQHGQLRRLIALGDGGFIKVKKDHYENHKFYNTPLAPKEGYKKAAIVKTGDFLFFRTADGKHYGKMDVGQAMSRGFKYITFEYIFQPQRNDRNLELKYGKDRRFKEADYIYDYKNDKNMKRHITIKGKECAYDLESNEYVRLFGLDKIRAKIVPEFNTYEDQAHYAFERYKYIEDYSSRAKSKIDWQFALDGYIKLFEKYPAQANINVYDLNRIGSCYFEMKDYENAKKYFQKALQIILERHLGKDDLKPSDSEAQKKKVQSIDYKWIARLYRRIELCYLKTEDPQVAINEFKKIVNDYDYIFDEYEIGWWDRYEVIGKAYENIAWIYYSKLKDYKKAFEAYEEIIRLFPNNHIVYPKITTYIGDLYREMGDVEKAREKYREIIDRYGTTINADPARRGLKLLESEN